MKITIHRLSVALLLSPFCFPLSALSQGSLTPPGAPTPTMKSLDQIEARTPIASVPYTIAVPGSYYVTTNLTVSGGDAITIAADGVTLDLNGFTIVSTAPSATGYGILIHYGMRNVAILNGSIQGGVTNNGSGVYSGSGFGYGIYGFPQGGRVSGVSVSGCLYYGIVLGTPSTTVVESCTVQTVGSSGIIAATIKASVAKDCGGDGIYGDQLADCQGESSGSSYGLYAKTAQNCYGQSSTGIGLGSGTALNCYGYSSSGTGLYASTAQNCYGFSPSGTGLQSGTALNCYGYSSSGTGLYASTAQNCYGYSSNGTGLTGVDIANSCIGESTSGTGLIAHIANSCSGWSTSGTAQAIAFKYNMP